MNAPPNYSYLDADGWVRQWSLEARPDVLEDGSLGPWQATPVAGLQIDLLPEGFAAKQNLRKVNGTYTDMTPTDPAPSSSCELQQSGEVLVWVETVPLADRIAAAIAKTYADIDDIYTDAVGNRTEEYKDAEADARAFKAAGYTGAVSDYVHDFALHNPTGSVQTDQWAADQIIGRADAFAAAKLSMRSQRFASQAAMRAAATNADLDAAVTTWRDFITTTRTNLQLPPAP